MTVRRLKSRRPTALPQTAIWLFACGLVVAPLAAQAGLITSAPVGGTVVDFSQFGSQQQVNVSATEVGQLVNESISLTDNGTDVRVGPMSHGIGTNGTWTRSGVLLNNATSGFFTFTFNNGAVSWVGGFMNYAAPAGAVATSMLIQALDSFGIVIEQYDLFTAAPISTPGGVNAGAFRGISRATNDIFGFRVAYDFAVIDDLTFARTSVPEPGTLALLGLGLAGLGLSRRRGAA